MRKKYHNVVRALVVLTMVIALVGAVVAPAAAAPTTCPEVTISPALSGAVGSAISVVVNQPSGAWDNLAVKVLFDGNQLTTDPAAPVVSSTTHQASCQFQVPATIAGNHALTVQVGFTQCTATFDVQPAVKISPLTGPAGTAVTVTGSGFGTTVPVTVTVSVGGSVVASGVSVNTDGSFTATGTIPSGLTAGAKDVTAVDGAGNSATKTGGFTVSPNLAVSPTAGLAGSKVTITGSGWAPSGTVTLTFGGQAWGSVSTDGFGAINQPAYATLTTTPSGAIAITGTQGTISAATTFSVQPRPLTVTPNSGPMGTKVTITAASLTPNGKVLVGDLEIGGQAWNASDIDITTGGALTPTNLVVLTALTPGANTVLLTDTGGLSASGIFTVTQPTLTVTPATGPVGSTITIQGTGWVPTSSVAIKLNATQVMTVNADANGNIAAALTVPSGTPAGPNQISATDGSNTAPTATFTVPGAYITVDPQEGSAGSAITITGSGFPGYAGVTLQFGSSFTIPTTVLTSPLGDFTLATTVPGVAPGSTVITATAGAASATTFYVVKTAAVTIKTQLAGVMDDLVIVWDYNGGDWLFYDPTDEAGSTLDTLEAGIGYWVKVSADVNLIYGGSSYQLTEGWNNIGWKGV